MLRVSNVGLTASFNFRIQGHKLKLVEVEGSHVIQNAYDSLDVHVGQTLTLLLTLDQPPSAYHVVASTKFTAAPPLTAAAILRYASSASAATGPPPEAPPTDVGWSVEQARSFRRNLTANAARPNPQGSYHYGNITTSRTIFVANSAPVIGGKQRYGVNGRSYVRPDTPLKLADHFNISGVFSLSSAEAVAADELATYVVGAALHEFIEIVFQNNEDSIQTWHFDGYDFWVVG